MMLGETWTFGIPDAMNDVEWLAYLTRAIVKETGASTESAMSAASRLIAAHKIAHGLEQVEVGLTRIADQIPSD